MWGKHGSRLHVGGVTFGGISVMDWDGLEQGSGAWRWPPRRDIKKLQGWEGVQASAAQNTPHCWEQVCFLCEGWQGQGPRLSARGRSLPPLPGAQRCPDRHQRPLARHLAAAAAACAVAPLLALPGAPPAADLVVARVLVVWQEEGRGDSREACWEGGRQLWALRAGLVRHAGWVPSPSACAMVAPPQAPAPKHCQHPPEL